MPSTRNRYRLLAGALLCALVVVAFAVLYKTYVKGLDDFDNDLGAGPQGFTFRHPAAQHFFLFIEVAFTTLPMTIYTAITAALLIWRKHVRAAVWTVGVMLGASLTTYFLKGFLQRKRPVWDDPVTTLTSFSFPSGHATGIAAAAGVIIVLAGLLVRRRGLRRALYVVAVALALLVGLDRIFLGVHNPSDVLAGYAVGVFWVLVGLAVYDPAPRAKPHEAFSTPVPTTKQLAVVLNPIKVEDVDAFRAMVDRRRRRAGWNAPTWYETTVEDPGRSMAEQAAVSAAPSWCSSAAATAPSARCAPSSPAPASRSAWSPAGTGNLLARNLGIPLYLQAAVDVALNGQDRAIDLVKVSGDGIGDDEHFMVMAGMGFDAAIMEGANEKIKAKVGWLAYVVSALRNLMFPRGPARGLRRRRRVDQAPGPHRADRQRRLPARPGCRCCPTPRSTTASSTW